MRVLINALAIVLPALAMIMLAACEPSPIRMEISDVGGRKLVTLFTLGFFGMRSSEPPCIRTITVSGFDALHQPTPVWRAVVPDAAQCVQVRSFSIGRAPAGFDETMRLIARDLHGRYRVEVEGIGRGDYDIVF
jgi:hypothetical protein